MGGFRCGWREVWGCGRCGVGRMVVCLATALRVLPGGKVLLVMLWAAGRGWWWWLWLDCLVVVVSAGGPDDGPWVCGGGWACLVVVMVCPCGWCWVWYHWACGLR